MAAKNKNIEYEIFSPLLNDRQFRFGNVDGLTRKSLHRWRKLGHIDDTREIIISGRPAYFSAVELIWISIITDLREMQIEHSKISELKFGLFAPVKAPNGKEYPALEYYMLQVFKKDITIYIVLNKSNELLIINDLIYHDKLKSGEIENHIAISLNKQIKDVLSEIFTIPDSNEFVGLSTQEIQVLQIIRNKTYKYINITKKDGEIKHLEGTEQILEASRITDLLKNGQYQDIEIKQHNGKVVCINRTIKKKITK
ncbi:hypothetical protein [uncultured Aquimarina sp.]|uniref:hypothetical protein n=1 Tax=uncultured Aquimarina sp. TaxID=575652 RepID=UPI00262DFE99|nr:hypothetical protein [uncultured Aquimarina sp.]